MHAAKGDYAQKVVAPAGNEADLHEVSQKQRQGIEFAFVATAAEGLKACLTRHPVKGFVLSGLRVRAGEASRRRGGVRPGGAAAPKISCLMACS